jgi:hypothetical protein
VKEREAYLIDVESGKTRQVQPSVKKHGAMACAEDESITVDPCAFIGVEGHGMAKKHSTKLSASQWKSEVPTGTLVNCVHGKATSLIGSTCEIGNGKGFRH